MSFSTVTRLLLQRRLRSAAAAVNWVRRTPAKTSTPSQVTHTHTYTQTLFSQFPNWSNAWSNKPLHPLCVLDSAMDGVPFALHPRFESQSNEKVKEHSEYFSSYFLTLLSEIFISKFSLVRVSGLDVYAGQHPDQIVSGHRERGGMMGKLIKISVFIFLTILSIFSTTTPF